jgi:hypothetical protein
LVRRPPKNLIFLPFFKMSIEGLISLDSLFIIALTASGSKKTGERKYFKTAPSFSFTLISPPKITLKLANAFTFTIIYSL